MDIVWLGHSCFQVRSGGTTLLTDPFGETPQAIQDTPPVDIVTISHWHPLHAGYQELPGSPRVIRGPGEYETSNIYIRGIGTPYRNPEDQRQINTVYLIEAEGLTLCHLGSLTEIPSSRQIEELGKADVLFVPVGGKDTINHKQAAEIINLISPRVAIPMHYRTNGADEQLEPLGSLLKEMGVKELEPVSKLSLTRSNLPQEIRLVALKKSG